MKIACDIQGTLCEPGGPVKIDFLRALLTLHAEGHEVTLCSSNCAIGLSETLPFYIEDSAEEWGFTSAQKEEFLKAGGFCDIKRKSLYTEEFFDIVLDDQAVDWCRFGVHIRPAGFKDFIAQAQSGAIHVPPVQNLAKLEL